MLDGQRIGAEGEEPWKVRWAVAVRPECSVDQALVQNQTCSPDNGESPQVNCIRESTGERKAGEVPLQECSLDSAALKPMRELSHEDMMQNFQHNQDWEMPVQKLLYSRPCRCIGSAHGAHILGIWCRRLWMLDQLAAEPPLGN